MKQVKFIAVTLVLVVAGMFSANAQKLAFVNGEEVVANMPEIQKINAEMKKYQEDSVGGTFERLTEEYKEKDSAYKNPKTAASVKTLLEKDLQELQYTLSNWQQIGNNALQNKQAQLLAPLYQKVREAISAVAKEKGIAYVLAPEAIIYSAPDAEDLTNAVAAKLGVKIPSKPPVSAPKK